MVATRVAVLLDRHQPGRTARSVAASANVPVDELTYWLTDADPPGDRPDGPCDDESVLRIAAAIGAPVAMVSRAFTGTWFDRNGWQWNHFQQGDQVVVFDAATDRATGSRQGRRGVVTDVDPLDVITVRLADGTEYRRDPDSAGSIHHLGHGCASSTPR